jgi:hypothetical protein
VTGSSVIGIGSLAYYGLGLSYQPGFIDKTSIWPKYVRDRINTTYQYFGTSLVFTGSTAWAVGRSPTLMNIVSRSSLLV